MDNSKAEIAQLNEYDSKNKGKKLDLNGVKCYAKCVGCYDGDTVTLVFPFADDYYYSSCRCMGYNTAEIRTKDSDEKKRGIEARDMLRELILDKIVFVEFGPNDKYGRPLATIHTLKNTKPMFRKSKLIIDRCIKDILIEAGMAQEYYGKGEKRY